jgi:CysZ protein
MVDASRPVGRALGAPRRGLGAFFHGLGFSFRGARLVYLEQHGLAAYWLVPIVVTVLALALSIAAVVTYEGAVTSWLWPEPAEGWDDLSSFFHALLEGLVILVMTVLAFVATLLASGIASAPFNARLAEILDERITGEVAPPFAIGRALRDVGRVIVIETTFFAVNALLLILSFAVPVLGPLTGALGLAFGALYFGVSYLETPQGTRGRSLGDRVRLVRDRPMEILGFGAGVGLFLFVPLLNLLFMPAAVAGGVLLHAELEARARQG